MRILNFRRAVAAGLAAAAALHPGEGLALTFRVVAANLTSGNGQDYDQGHGIRILEGIGADVVLVQEFNYFSNTPANLRTMAELVCGTGAEWFRETGTGSIPNGIISRFPLLESGQWFSQVAERDYSWARIDLPGDRELLAVSVHLPTDSSKRPAEALDLAGYVQNYLSAGGGTRAADYVVIGGDFNTDSRMETCLDQAHLGKVVTIGTSHPADHAGNTGTNAGRSKPYDAVYAGAALHALQVPTVTGASSFAHGLVVDTRVYSPLADISPAMLTDSGAANMQHMAVVKDFRLPPAADPPVLEVISTRFSPMRPGKVEITFRATEGAVYEAQAASTLTATPPASAWSSLGTFTAAGTTPTLVVVSEAASPMAGQVVDPALFQAVRRFYRVVRR